MMSRSDNPGFLLEEKDESSAGASCKEGCTREAPSDSEMLLMSLCSGLVLYLFCTSSHEVALCVTLSLF